MIDFEIVEDGADFIVCADGQRVLSCKSFLIALRAVADATLLLDQPVARQRIEKVRQWL
jgi:hypothetical protein